MTDALAAQYSTGETLNYDKLMGSFTGLWPNYVYSSYPYVQSVDRGRQAFQIARALADKKIVTTKTANDFIDLVELIFREL